MAETTQEPSVEETPKEAEPPQWEYRKRFKVNEGMKEVVQLSIDLSRAEVSRYREKLRKLTYGA